MNGHDFDSLVTAATTQFLSQDRSEDIFAKSALAIFLAEAQKHPEQWRALRKAVRDKNKVDALISAVRNAKIRNEGGALYRSLESNAEAFKEMNAQINALQTEQLQTHKELRENFSETQKQITKLIEQNTGLEKNLKR